MASLTGDGQSQIAVLFACIDDSVQHCTHRCNLWVIRGVPLPPLFGLRVPYPHFSGQLKNLLSSEAICGDQITPRFVGIKRKLGIICPAILSGACA